MKYIIATLGFFLICIVMCICYIVTSPVFIWHFNYKRWDDNATNTIRYTFNRQPFRFIGDYTIEVLEL